MQCTEGDDTEHSRDQPRRQKTVKSLGLDCGCRTHGGAASVTSLQERIYLEEIEPNDQAVKYLLVCCVLLKMVSESLKLKYTLLQQNRETAGEGLGAGTAREEKEPNQTGGWERV